MKFSIKDIFSKCDQIHTFLRIWSHLLKKSIMENFIFCAVSGWTFPELLGDGAKMLSRRILLQVFFTLV